MNKEFNLDKITGFFDKFFDGTFLDNEFVYVLIFIALVVLLAYVVRYVFTTVFESLAQKTQTKYDDEILDILKKPVFNSVLFVGFWTFLYSVFAQGSFWEYISGTVLTFFLFMWIFAAVGIVKILVELVSKRKRIKMINKQTLPLFRNLFVILVYSVGIYIIFAAVWGVDMTAFIASLGVVGIAFGLASKDTLSNLFAGIFIIADAPYKVGDYIILDSGERGKVTSIGIRSTRILTALKTEISVPNSVIGNEKILNESQGEGESFVLGVPFSVSYGEDVEKVEKIVNKIATDKQFDEFRVLEKEPTIRFSTMGASSLDFNLYLTLKDPLNKGSIKSVLNTKIYNTFNKENIEIPYAKQDLYIKEMPENKK